MEPKKVNIISVFAELVKRIPEAVKMSYSTGSVGDNFQGGLEWVDSNKLCDLDYADEIALIETSQCGM